MKTLILITSLLLIAPVFLRAVEPPQATPAKSKSKIKKEAKPPGQSVRSLDEEITAIQNKHPILHDAASAAREKQFRAAAAGLNDDPEIQKLQAEVRQAFQTVGGVRNAAQPSSGGAAC